MKVILDTNVFVSGIFWSGSPFEILQLWKTGKIQLVLSNEILEEYQRVSKELSQGFPGIDLTEILTLLVEKSTLCTTSPLESQVCGDPDDDKFLACALSAKVKQIVSGDKLLLKVSGYKGISILTPKEFLKLFKEKEEKAFQKQSLKYSKKVTDPW